MGDYEHAVEVELGTTEGWEDNPFRLTMVLNCVSLFFWWLWTMLDTPYLLILSIRLFSLWCLTSSYAFIRWPIMIGSVTPIGSVIPDWDSSCKIKMRLHSPTVPAVCDLGLRDKRMRIEEIRNECDGLTFRLNTYANFKRPWLSSTWSPCNNAGTRTVELLHGLTADQKILRLNGLMIHGCRYKPSPQAVAST